MSQRLVSLVQADPELMIYALEHLGENVPAKTGNLFYSRMLRTVAQPISAELLALLMGKDPIRRLTPEQTARLEKIWGGRADETANLMRNAHRLQEIAHSLQGADVVTIRSRLRDANPAVRQLVIQIIAQRRLPLEGDLIDLLHDSSVSSTAHDALVRLARGTDFGPIPRASRKGIARSIEKWHQWLALQQSESPETLARDAALLAAGKQTRPALLAAVPLVLEHDVRPSLSPQATKTCEELVQAKTEEQSSLLARLREGKDTDSLEVLVLAIPHLQGDVQHEAREALLVRLTRLPTSALRDRLQDDRLEMRCAAALACGRNLARDHVPDLVQLLDDPERDVVQTARAVLTELTGEDFGPSRDADRRSRDKALAAWRDWYKQHSERN